MKRPPCDTSGNPGTGAGKTAALPVTSPEICHGAPIFLDSQLTRLSHRHEEPDAGSDDEHDALQVPTLNLTTSSGSSAASYDATTSSRAVPASIVHSYQPKPKPPVKTKLTSLPPELLLSVFAYLPGDPTRADNVTYRGASDEPDRWYAHAWSLMQVAKTCRYLRAVAGPMLYSHAALLHKEDFVRVARLPDRARARIRHLTVSITVLEQLYVHLTVHLPRICWESPPTLPTKQPYLRGTPFAPFFSPSQLSLLTLFRPHGASTRSGDAVMPGFMEFFLTGSLGYWEGAESVHVQDATGVWLVLDGKFGHVSLSRTRRLTWDIGLELLRLGDSPRELALRRHYHPRLTRFPPQLRVLRAKSAPTCPLPGGLEVLHVLPPGGLSRSALRALDLPRLSALRSLRLSLSALESLAALVLPAELRVLRLHLPCLPAADALSRVLGPLSDLRALSLVVPPPTPTAPTRAMCETDAAHSAHLPLARAVLGTLPALREVQLGGACACVWGRPCWVSATEDGDAVVWLGAGERTPLD
ncbi:hypothetical protein AURDEDRAFT_165988 [Auricularia subglabra TFB-10046 SS5]|nr:hypothetical protein AURDEDRAFT_165988 [Auricularia subglabra TFB-10046 SS5]